MRWFKEQPITIRGALIGAGALVLIFVLAPIRDRLFPPEIKIVNQNTETDKVSLNSDSIPAKKEFDELSSPNKLLEKINESPPLFREEAGKRYIGINIDWTLELLSIAKTRGDSIRIILKEIKGLPSAIIEVPLSKYRKLTVLPQGNKVRVKGEISDFDDFFILIKNAELFF